MKKRLSWQKRNIKELTINHRLGIKPVSIRISRKDDKLWSLEHGKTISMRVGKVRSLDREASNKAAFGKNIGRQVQTSPLIFLTAFGIKRDSTKRATAINTLDEINRPQSPEAQTSFNVPMRKVKIKVATDSQRGSKK